MTTLRNISSYIKAGYLLHLITLSELLIFGFLYQVLDISSTTIMSSGPMLKLIVVSASVGMPLFAQLDARSRYQNYKMVKERLYVHGFQPRILKPFRKSRCQRDAARAAAMELGLSLECKKYFSSHGYRWYHLFPDLVFKKPGILLNKNFWITTLFTKTYHPGIDLQRLQMT